MKEHNLNDWIDQYLLGTIDPEHKAQLEQLMARDAVVAERVRDSQVAFEAIRLVRNRHLREKMREWDLDPPHQQGLILSRAGRIGIFLVGLLVCIYLAGQYFHPSCLAQRNFIDVNSMVTESSPGAGEMSSWKGAEVAFKQGDFGKAILMYTSLAESPLSDQQYTARWNLLMAQLAVEGPNADWLTSLDAFVHHAPEPLASGGRRLSEMLRNPLYRWVYASGASGISQIKPRLI